MASRAIRLYGDPVLRKRAKRVDATADETRELVDDLFATLKNARGLGLAAPQIGVSARVYVVDLSPVELGAKPIALVNPEVLSAGEPIRGEEGCLSFPGLFVDVDRPEEARVRYQTLEGETQEIEAKGLMARVILHELDHLDGVLFIDGLSAARRVLIEAKLRRTQRRQRKGETA